MSSFIAVAVVFTVVLCEKAPSWTKHSDEKEKFPDLEKIYENLESDEEITMACIHMINLPKFC